MSWSFGKPGETVWTDAKMDECTVSELLNHLRALTIVLEDVIGDSLNAAERRDLEHFQRRHDKALEALRRKFTKTELRAR